MPRGDRELTALRREVVSRGAVAAGAVCGWNISVEYRRRWSASDSVAGFGQGICDAWAREYSAGAELDPDDLVVVDPGNGFSYLFRPGRDIAGEPCSRAPRVVGVWSLSRPGAIDQLTRLSWLTPEE